MAIAPSYNEIYDIGKGEAQARRPELSFNVGDVTSSLMHGSAAMADSTILYGASLSKKLYLDTSFGIDLDTLALDRYTITRTPATAATVSLSFTRTSGGAAGNIPAGTTVTTQVDASGQQVSFTTDSPIVVPITNNGPFTVNATATILGPDGNVSAAAVDTITSTLFDSTFIVTNAASAAGGNDQESDAALRQRCRDYSLTLRRGTAAAIRYGALEVPAVRFASTFEGDFGTGSVVISDQDGNSTLQMIADVTVELENWRCLAVPITVIGASPYVVDLTLTVRHVDGFPIDAVASQLVAAVEAKIDAIGPGQTLTQHDIVAAVIALYPSDLSKVNFVAINGNGSPLSLTSDITPPLTYQKVSPGVITVTGE